MAGRTIRFPGPPVPGVPSPLRPAPPQQGDGPLPRRGEGFSFYPLYLFIPPAKNK